MMYNAVPYGQVRGNVPKDGWGPCRGAAACADDPNTFVQWLKDKGLFKWTRSASGLTIDAGTEIVLFQKGQDQEDTGAGWPTGITKSKADTNLFNDGIPTEDDTVCFEINGMEIDVQNPRTFDTDRFDDPEWLQAYEDKLVERTIQNAGITYTHGFKKCEWDLGNLGDWAKNAGGAVGPNVTSNGPKSATGIYIPLAQADYIPGGRNAPYPLKVKLKMPAGYDQRVNEKASPPSVADAYVLVEVKLVGRYLPKGCANGPVCVPDGMTQEQAQAVLLGGLTQAELEVVAQMRRNKANGQGPG